MDEKAQTLLKLFMCFPSTTGLSEETSAMMVASYLETLSTFSPDTLAKGCDSFKRRSTRFAPSVGEIYERCAEIQHKAIRDAKFKLSPPDDRLGRLAKRTDREKANVKAMIEAFKAGVPEDPFKKLPTRAPTEGEAKDWLMRHEGGKGLKPVQLSDRMLAIFGVDTELADGAAE